MRTFPMFLKTTGRRIVILGGGEQAAQKARLALKSDAEIVLAWPEVLDPELAGLVAEGRATHWTGPVTPALFELAALVFVATGCPGTDAALAPLARLSGAVVNVVDAPELCDAFTPSIVDRDPVVVAIGTEGTAPVLGRRIKTDIETMLEPRLGALAALAGRLRGAVAANVPKPARRDFWRWAFTGAPRRLHATGRERDAATLLKEAIEAGGARVEDAGMVSLVGAGPGRRDLLTLRAVERLQEADIIFYDRLVDEDVLELARRDAERVPVGKAPGAHAWPQDRINGVIVAAAKAGQRVVRLKSGDPGIFGRAAEEIEALDAAGIPWDIVPGVTAASAAAARTGAPLTERGETDTIIFATAKSAGGAPNGLAAKLSPGTTLAIYMGAARARDIASELLSAGHAPGLGVEIVSHAEQPNETRRTTDLAGLMEMDDIANPAIIFVRSPLVAAAETARPMTAA